MSTTNRSGRVFWATMSVTTGMRGRPANSQEWNRNTSVKARARRPSTDGMRALCSNPGFSPTANPCTGERYLSGVAGPLRQHTDGCGCPAGCGDVRADRVLRSRLA
ncbi:hypothetical protein [Ornithinimicrobium kibberense]|uniref:hypothetical protein n=1 Tax=Ornithinimicrobium kibberense TaxID=282060 RepID=UPI003612D723